MPVGYVADQRADYRRLVTQVDRLADPQRDDRRLLGGAGRLDDDPRPAITVRPVARHVPAGSPAQWRVRLDKPVDFDFTVTGKVVKGPGTPVRVSDIAKSWTDLHTGPVAPGKPLWTTYAMTYDFLSRAIASW